MRRRYKSVPKTKTFKFKVSVRRINREWRIITYEFKDSKWIPYTSYKCWSLTQAKKVADQITEEFLQDDSNLYQYESGGY